MKQKIAKSKFVNWSWKIERIVDLKMANEQNLITFILNDLWTVIYFSIKSHKIEHTFKTYD